jgi:hypothetical protein
MSTIWVKLPSGTLSSNRESRIHRDPPISEYARRESGFVTRVYPLENFASQAQYSGNPRGGGKSVVRVALLLAAYGAKTMLATPEGLH